MSQGFPLFAFPQVPRQEGEGQEGASSLWQARGASVPRDHHGPGPVQGQEQVHVLFELGQLCLQHSQASRSAEPKLTAASP